MADLRSTSTLSDNSQISDPHFSFIWDLTFDGTLIAYSGTDPGKNVNVWSYNVKKKTYVIEQDDRNTLWSDHQGSSHVYY